MAGDRRGLTGHVARWSPLTHRARVAVGVAHRPCARAPVRRVTRAGPSRPVAGSPDGTTRPCTAAEPRRPRGRISVSTPAQAPSAPRRSCCAQSRGASCAASSGSAVRGGADPQLRRPAREGELAPDREHRLVILRGGHPPDRRTAIGQARITGLPRPGRLTCRAGTPMTVPAVGRRPRSRQVHPRQ